VKLDVSIPRADSYVVYARLKGAEGAEFTIAGQKVSAPAAADWKWVKSEAKVALGAGKQTLIIASSKHGSCLDCFYLSTDDAFDPAGRIVAEVPRAPTLKGELREGYPQLAWACEKDKRFHHFNLYASTKPDFTPSRKTLIASPDGAGYLDWRAPAGGQFYRITQFTLDGLESAPSNAVELTKP